LARGPGIPTSWIGTTPLHIASLRGEHEIAALLVQRGADVNARGGENQFVPLHGAAAGGHADVANALVAAGANVRIRDGAFGATPEAWARFFGHHAVADLLKRLA
jgi:ankyrin repeat protein